MACGDNAGEIKLLIGSRDGPAGFPTLPLSHETLVLPCADYFTSCAEWSAQSLNFDQRCQEATLSPLDR